MYRRHSTVTQQLLQSCNHRINRGATNLFEMKYTIMASTSCSDEYDKIPDLNSNNNFTFIYFDEYKDFIPTPFSESLSFKNYTHVAHCMIYALSSKMFEGCNPRAFALMLLRNDGHIGFPGGTVDEEEHIITALNRELNEEIALDSTAHGVVVKDHVITQVNHVKKLVTHFFALEVTLDEFSDIEKRCLDARDYGTEVLGILRVCFHTMKNNYGGFPAFLRQNFIGNCKQHLCIGLLSRHILTRQEIEEGLLRTAKDD